MKKIKVIHKHRKNCSALKQGWDTPWMLQDTYFQGWKHCVRLICNSTTCKGELRIFTEIIEKQFNDYGL